MIPITFSIFHPYISTLYFPIKYYPLTFHPYIFWIIIPQLQVRSGQVRSGQVRSGQVRSGQVRSGQVNQIRPGQARPGRAGSGQFFLVSDLLLITCSSVLPVSWSGCQQLNWLSHQALLDEEGVWTPYIIMNKTF